jgi:hypothetical protein
MSDDRHPDSIAPNVSVDSGLYLNMPTIGVFVCSSCDSPTYCGCLEVKCNCLGPMGAYCSYCEHYPISSRAQEDNTDSSGQATPDPPQPETT